MKRIYLLICTALLLISCSGPQGSSAGIINGNRISYPEYIRSLQGHTIEFRTTSNQPPDTEQKKQIFLETWRDISMHVILKDYFSKYNISTNEMEVLDTLSLNIPPLFRQAEVFQTNGNFDSDLYLQSLRYDSPINMAATRRHYYEYYIPIQKLKPRIIDDELLNKKTTRSLSEIISSTVDFDLLVFDPQNMNAVVSEQELKNYYQQNIDKYAMRPVYSLSYISIPIGLQEHDLQYTAAVADSIYSEISHGKSFEIAHAERQAYLPGLKIQDSGFVKVENVAADVLTIVEALPENVQSKLIQQDNGYFIYQKMQRTKSMIRYRALQIPPVISPSTISAQHGNALGALNLARNLGIAEAASELGLRHFNTENLSPSDKWHQDALVVSTVESKLLSHKKGDFLEPIYSPATGSWIIALLEENQVNRAYPYQDIKADIETELKVMRQAQLAKQKAQEWLIQNPELTVRTNSQDYTLVSYAQSSVDANYKGHELVTPFLNSHMALQYKQRLQVEQLGEISVILIPRRTYKQEGSKADPQTVRRLFLKTLSPDWFETWMENKLNTAKVQIFVSP